jgi:hypothetical protein
MCRRIIVTLLTLIVASLVPAYSAPPAVAAERVVEHVRSATLDSCAGVPGEQCIFLDIAIIDQTGQARQVIFTYSVDDTVHRIGLVPFTQVAVPLSAFVFDIRPNGLTTLHTADTALTFQRDFHHDVTSTLTEVVSDDGQVTRLVRQDQAVSAQVRGQFQSFSIDSPLGTITNATTKQVQ